MHSCLSTPCTFSGSMHHAYARSLPLLCSRPISHDSRAYIRCLAARTKTQCLKLPPEVICEREVDFVDIAYDEVSPKNYKDDEDVRFFQSTKTMRGPLVEGWRDTMSPVMCSYKLVQVSFEVWGLQTKAEDMIHRVSDS
ncbi:hypothetical protein PR048_026374 [Dryococelus australis]|uniref:Phosphatidylinositol transfer protein N-terminal domain-containing protein n=1 Tax=Dryococelus australis TaxID=614101 RepID=A0ABQ9GL61_9NEOP|nr:hypothetical protein PR048_026374 [Dryococelus australis]